MTQFVDFVALGWVEKNLRGEMDAARRSLHHYQREPEENQHLRDAGRFIHSATGALRLCSLEPAAMLSEEVEKVLQLLHDGVISGDARKAAMTELVAAIEALPAYLATVRSKREVTPASIANVVNDLRKASQRPILPESLFFDPPLTEGLGVSKVAVTTDDNLCQFATQARDLWQNHAKAALKGSRGGLQQMRYLADRATGVLAGSYMEPCCRAFGLLAADMADKGLQVDEAIAAVFSFFEEFFADLETRGFAALQAVAPQNHLKHMLYYIGRAEQRSAEAQDLLDTFGIDNVDHYIQVAEGRMIQEDDLLDALGQTLEQLKSIMSFLSSPQEKICASNTVLAEKIVPNLLQVGMQLHVIGLGELASNVNLQYKTLSVFAQRDKPTPPAELVDFGGALSAIRDEIEFKLKHGLSAVGNAATLDLESAITRQVSSCLQEMKSGLNRELARQGLEAMIEAGAIAIQPGPGSLRPIYRAARLIATVDLMQSIDQWEHTGYPDPESALAVAHGLLGQLNEGNHIAVAANHLEQVISVLSMMGEKQRERDILRKCTGFINGSIALGGIVPDESLQCFTQVIAALEQYLECRSEDPWSNPEQHLQRAESRAARLVSYLSQRTNRNRPEGNVVEFGEKPAEKRPQLHEHAPVELQTTTTGPASDAAPLTADDAESFTVTEEGILSDGETAAQTEAAPGASEAPVAATGGDLPWRDALASWSAMDVTRPAEPLPEGPEHEIDRELLECFVEEFGEYLGKLNESAEQLHADPLNAGAIKDIRVVFHTLKGSARTIDLGAFGDFMYDLERIFNNLRDGLLQGSAELAELVLAVSRRLPYYAGLIGGCVPLLGEDFAIPATIARAIEDRQLSDSMTVSVAGTAAVAADNAVSEETGEAVESIEFVESDSEEIILEVIAGENAVEIAADADREAETEVDASAGAEPEVPAEESFDYSVELWSSADSLTLLTAIHRTLAAHQPAPRREEIEHAEMVAAAAIPAMLELRDKQLVEIGVDNAGYFLELTGMQHLASGSVYGLEERADGVMDRISLSAESLESLETYLGTIEDNPALEHLHNCALRLLQAALSLAEVTPLEQEPREEQVAPLPDNVVALRHSTQDVDSHEYVVEEIDDELLDLFIETLVEYTESTDAAMVAMAMGETNALRDLKNTLHTVKGAANSIGLRQFGALVHDFESRIADLEYAEKKDEKAIQHSIDALVAEFNEAAQFVTRNRADYDETALAEEAAAGDLEGAGGERAAASDGDHAEGDKRLSTLRIETTRVDHLLDMGLEVSMGNVRCRQALDRASQDRGEINALARRIQALVDQLSLQLDTEIQAKTEIMSEDQHFDPLEMDRITEKQAMAAILREAAFDLQEESREMGLHLDSAIREVQSTSRLLQSSQSDLRQMRLVSFSRLGPGFRRLVHQVSRQLGKQVEFDFNCGDGGLDVTVFEQIRTALEHMLRNSIDHGIASPEERKAQGKRDTGKVQLSITRRGSEFVIRLLDDGNGIDPDRLRRKALDLGILAGNDDISDEEALRLVFHSGLSTAQQVTDVSGRGVGMDVVHQSITQSGGTIEIQSKPGFYTQFEIRVPASIMVNEALLATLGEEQIAIPLTSLRGSEYYRRDKVLALLDNPESRLQFRGQDYEVRYLGTVRGTMPPPTVETLPDFSPALFAQLGRRRVAFFADALDTAEDLVIRSLGAQFTGVPGVAGGAVKSDGQPVLALDLNEFIAQVDYADNLAGGNNSKQDEKLLVLCVDDSVMMRRTYEKRLGSIGYNVVTAVDGEDALDYLSQAPRAPDFIFTDLEMPKMNGFDFIANLRRVPDFAHIPTVVVSSRDADKHRSEADRVGATDFMAKGNNSAEGMQAMINRYLLQVPEALVS
ncbi:response regulator [Haliea sp. E17]|uniref:response regulator n=1 Tax=Haliea sp. E17 TaxID=3401576 RepID=UPI003AACFF91